MGPQLGRILQQQGWYWPYITASIILLFNFCYVHFLLPDSNHSPATSKLASKKYANDEGESLKDSLLNMKKKTITSLLLVACFLYSFGNQDISSTLVLYLNFRFGWTQDNGIPTVFTIMGSLLVIYETFGSIISYPTKCKGISLIAKITSMILDVLDTKNDKNTTIQETQPLSEDESPNFFFSRISIALLPVLLIVASIGHVLIGVSETPWLFYVGLVIGSSSVVCRITLNSLISMETSPGRKPFFGI